MQKTRTFFKSNQIIMFIALATFIVFPLVASEYLVHIMVTTLMFAYLGTCWNIIGGYAGQPAFGHTIFFGIGAYIPAILVVNYDLVPWISMFVAAFLSLVISLIIGYLSFRYHLKGLFYGLTTLAFAQIFYYFSLNFFPGKAAGIMLPLAGDSWKYFQFTSRVPYYYIILAFLLIILLVSHLIKRSKLGLYLMAIKEDEDAAAALGIDVTRNKLIATGISCFFTAFAGVFYTQYLTFVNPETSFRFVILIDILLGPIVGGLGTLFGPLVGSVVLSVVDEVALYFFSQFRGVNIIASGIILILVILFMPKGLVPKFSLLKQKLFPKNN